MRTLRLLVCLALFAGWLTPRTHAAATRASTKNAPTPGVELATLATQVTGIAISPLLGVGAVGAYQYFKAPDAAARARLPWFARPGFWLPALLVVGLCAFKDAFGALVPTGLKKPLDVLELAENKVSALIATGAVLPILVNMASRYLGGDPSTDASTYSTAGLAMIHLAALDMSWLLDLVLLPVAVAVFAIVWLASNAINVLILLSPWGAVDGALKVARTAVLGIVTGTAYVDPVVGFTVSAIIVLGAYFIAGWSYRLTIFGSVFLWDFVSFRRHRFVLSPERNWVFLGREEQKVPIRTFGRLVRGADGSVQLRYRPWLILSPRTLTLPSRELAVGRGFLWPTVEIEAADGKCRTLLTLPPRYKGHEDAFAEQYGITRLLDVGLRRGWTVLKELFGRRGLVVTSAKPPELESSRA